MTSNTKRSSTNQYKRYCCVYGCLRKRKNTDNELSFFKIPDDVERKKQWLALIDREDLLDKKTKNNYICSEHFDDSAIVTTVLKRLKSDATPTKCLPTAKKGGDLNTEPPLQTSKVDETVVPTDSYIKTETQEEIEIEFEPEPQITVKTSNEVDETEVSTDSDTQSDTHEELAIEFEMSQMKPQATVLSKPKTKK